MDIKYVGNLRIIMKLKMSHGKPWNHFSRGVTDIISSISCVTIQSLYRNSILLQNLMARLSAMEVVCLKSFIMADDVTNEVLSLGLVPFLFFPNINRKYWKKIDCANQRRGFRYGFRAILLCGDPDYYLRQGFILLEH